MHMFYECSETASLGLLHKKGFVCLGCAGEEAMFLSALLQDRGYG